MAVSYQNWRGRHVEVPDETLAAVLAAIDPGGTTALDPPVTGGPAPT